MYARIYLVTIINVSKLYCSFAAVCILLLILVVIWLVEKPVAPHEHITLEWSEQEIHIQLAGHLRGRALLANSRAPTQSLWRASNCRS